VAVAVNETEIAYAGVAGQAELIRNGEISSVELTQTLLKRIERLNPSINAFRIVMADEALAEAATRDGAGAGRTRPLHGVPIAIKDEIDVAGQLTTFGTAARTRPAAADGELVARLRTAGAVIIGKTTMPEFGQWPFTESAAFGYTRNPWDLSRSTGGSSGGTAAAVAAGMVAVGIGGDGGGSIRIPSACCGLYGLKPTRGLVSTAPYQHLWHALGTQGPLARSVRDSALVYDAIRTELPGHELGFATAAATDPPRLRIALSRKPAQRGVRLDAEQAGAMVHQFFERGRAPALLAHEIDQHAGIEVAAARAHDQAAARRQAHAGVDRHPVAHRRDACAVAQMGDEQAARQAVGQLVNDRFARQAVEPVALDPLRAQLARKR